MSKTRADKYRPDISWEDYVAYCRAHADETGYNAYLVVRAEAGPGGEAYAEAHLLPVGTPLLLPGAVHTRGPWPMRNVSRHVSIALHLAAQAYAELEAHPWLWSPEQRRAARGD